MLEVILGTLPTVKINHRSVQVAYTLGRPKCNALQSIADCVQIEEGSVLSAGEDSVLPADLRDDAVYELRRSAGQDSDSHAGVLLSNLGQNICNGRKSG